MSLNEIIISYPLRRNDLHRMRISGKPLRYTMEIGEYCFGAEFKKCLAEIKVTLELMGEIHDADVMIPELNMHIKEIRLFNSTIPEPENRISTKQLRDIVTQLRNSRREMYDRLKKKLYEWKRANFKQTIINAMR
jgi:CHAD domain-containing protein